MKGQSTSCSPIQMSVASILFNFDDGDSEEMFGSEIAASKGPTVSMASLTSGSEEGLFESGLATTESTSTLLFDSDDDFDELFGESGVAAKVPTASVTVSVDDDCAKQPFESVSASTKSTAKLLFDSDDDPDEHFDVSGKTVKATSPTASDDGGVEGLIQMTAAAQDEAQTEGILSESEPVDVFSPASAVSGWSPADVVAWCMSEKLQINPAAIMDANLDGSVLLDIDDEILEKDLGVQKKLQRMRALKAIAKLAAADAAVSTNVKDVSQLALHLTPSEDLKKFVGPKMRLGKAGEAAAGLKPLLGIGDLDVSAFLVDPIKAIKREFAANGTIADQERLCAVLNGTKVDGRPGRLLTELLKHPDSQAAGLGLHHIAALRVYTTKAYKAINKPLRGEPEPIRPHPFAATVYFIADAIGLLRQVDASKAELEPRTYWRGIKNMTVTAEFIKIGGTDRGCMSATTDRDIAIRFAASNCPLILRIEAENFMARGADVAFLSVFPREREVLYPPLTYLQPIDSATEWLGSVLAHVVRVRPTLGAK